MANTIQIKTGSTKPGDGILSQSELGFDKVGGNLYIGNNGKSEKITIKNLEDGSGEGSLQQKGCIASGKGSFAIGYKSEATGPYSHAEGSNQYAELFPDKYMGNTASEKGAHAEGYTTSAEDVGAHAEGVTTIASGTGSHAEGSNCQASGHSSHAEGHETFAGYTACHSEGFETATAADYQHVQGKYNLEDATKAFIIGNGEKNARSNALTVDWKGNLECAGNVKQIPIQIDLQNQNDEKEFERQLDSILQTMPIRSTQTILVNVYPAVSGSDFYGTLVNVGGGWAVLKAFSYNETQLYKEKINNIWQPTQKFPVYSDRIVVAGTSGNWYYRKYKNNVADLNYHGRMNLTHYTENGDHYCFYTIIDLPFAIGTNSTNIKSLTASIKAGNGFGTVSGIWYLGDNNLELLFESHLSGTVNFEINIHACVTWGI